MTEVIRNDGVLINAMTRMGTRNDKTEYTQVNQSTVLNLEDKLQLSQVFPLSKMLTAYPSAAISKGWSVKVGDEAETDEIKKFNDYRATIGGATEDEDIISDYDCFWWASYLANVTGGAAIVIVADDRTSPAEPLNIKNLRTIKSLEILDSSRITPDLSQTNDPFRARHYHILKPALKDDRLNGLFEVAKSQEWDGMSVHRSRVIRFGGRPCHPDLMIRQAGWERSLLDEVYDAFVSWKSAYKGIGALLDDYSLFIWSCQGLRDMVDEGLEDALRARFQAMRMMTSLLGGVAIDAEGEKIDFAQRSFQSVPELMDKFRDFLIGASGIPHTILFGESPSGLGATGESEERTWAKSVREYQMQYFLPKLRRLFRLIWLAKDGPTGGQEPEGWALDFNPLLEQSEEEKIANLSGFVAALSQGVNTQFLLADEARKSIALANEGNYAIALDEKLWEDQQQQDDQSFDFGGMPGLGDPAAEALPPEEAPPETVQQDSMRLDEAGEGFADKDAHRQAYNEAKHKFKVFPSRYAGFWIRRRYKEILNEKRKGDSVMVSPTGRLIA